MLTLRFCRCVQFSKALNIIKLSTPNLIISREAKCVIKVDYRPKVLPVRPISPHVSIYKFEMPAIQSMCHRISGIAISSYLSILAVGQITLPNDWSYYISALGDLELNNMVIIGFKWIIAFPFILHATGGIRHFIWDFGYFLQIKQVFLAGYITFGTAILVTTLVSAM